MNSHISIWIIKPEAKKFGKFTNEENWLGKPLEIDPNACREAVAQDDFGNSILDT